MDIKNSVAFVTGANRSLGLELVKQLQARGAAKIYAGARMSNMNTWKPLSMNGLFREDSRSALPSFGSTIEL